MHHMAMRLSQIETRNGWPKKQLKELMDKQHLIGKATGLAYPNGTITNTTLTFV